MSKLASLLYISLAPSSADEGVMRSILASARRRNEALGVSGALLKYAGYYLQVLEGDHETVHALYERIRRDARHFDVRLVAFEATPQRLFSSWAMHHVPEPQAQDRAVTDFMRGLWRGRGAVQAHTARSLLRRLITDASAASASSPSAVPAHH
jgi:Sensors of blue-light using FAD